MHENRRHKSYKHNKYSAAEQISFDNYLQNKLTKKEIDIMYPPDCHNQYVSDTQYTITNHIDQNQIQLKPEQFNKAENLNRQSHSLGEQAYWTRRKRIFCGLIIIFICIAIVLIILLPLVLIRQIDENRQFCSWFATKIIKVKLYWNDTDADLDLFVKQPWGDQVYFDKRSGNFGQLQRDVRNGPGPEIYSANCTSMGVYQISAQYYDPKGSVISEVQIFAGDRNLTIYNQFTDDKKKVLAKIIVEQLYGIGDFRYNIQGN